jgi:hypothetical protein
MPNICRRFAAAVWVRDLPAYKFAHGENMHPTVLSKLLHGIEKVKPNDPRILAVAKVVGLSPNACFKQE